MDHSLSSPHCGGRRIRWLIRRWLVPSLMAWLALAASAAPASVQSRPGGEHDGDLAIVRGILTQPESDIDLATAKLTIDQLMDPGIDVRSTLRQLDAMAASLKAAIPANAPSRLKLEMLRQHLYTANAWNGSRPYHYDLDDPLGQNLRNKLLPVYLETRAGNCVSMPLLFVVLGQKLGIDLSIATSPNHVFVKYRDERGEVFNLETTSGAGFTRDVWMRQQFPMTDEAIASGTYMRPLSRKESVVVMVGTLLEFYERRGLRELQLKMSRMVLDHNPRDVAILLHQHAAWLWFRNLLVNRYVTPDDMPAAERALLARHDAALRALFVRAWALGWRPPDEGQDEAVRQRAAKAEETQLEKTK
jgi:regulator of sirC expression with transglutaminase-like and TPR domain